MIVYCGLPQLRYTGLKMSPFVEIAQIVSKEIEALISDNSQQINQNFPCSTHRKYVYANTVMKADFNIAQK